MKVDQVAHGSSALVIASVLIAAFWSSATFAADSSEFGLRLVGQTNSQSDADQNKRPRTIANPSADERKRPGKDVEQNVLDMVDKHLPEVKTLLDQLRKRAPKQYDMAIRSLARSARRLQTAEKRGEEAFQLELQIIKAQSSLNVLIAKLKLRDSESDREALAAATENLAEAELAKMKHDLATLKSRIKRMQQQVSEAEARIKTRESDFAAMLKKNLELNLRKTGRKPNVSQ
ncbi:hypothetical protein U8335_06595 [Roseiconus lacunae]|uniref:hypothetical protein n=1 Tax=Roseiconus lacunae TaxID=2605694 RepID=UPI00308E42B0|nr:hypothetical protein U8335_06595 [Stieleria sp. HD01]